MNKQQTNGSEHQRNKRPWTVAKPQINERSRTQKNVTISGQEGSRNETKTGTNTAGCKRNQSNEIKTRNRSKQQ